MVKKILVSQPKPTSDKSPYYDIARDFDVELVFRPFIKVEGMTQQEFRKQKVNIPDYTAIVFTSRHAIDHFFQLTKEMRITMPETTKYFCVTETIALYIQKYAPYRKRKIFFGETGKIDDLLPAMTKHKTEKYLVPVSNNFTEEEKKNFDYDMAIFFSPAGIKALHEDFPDMKPGDIKIATFGPATAKAVREMGLSLALEAPTERYPSMTGALRHFLQEEEE